MTSKTVQLSSGEEIRFFWQTPDQLNWSRYRKVFVDAFSTQLKDIPLSELDPRAKDRETLFNEWFDEEARYEQDWIRKFCNRESENERSKFFFLEARSGEGAIAYSIWHLDPDQVLYFSSLVVLPAWQKKTVGTKMVYAIKEKLPSLKELVLNTRKSELNPTYQYLRKLHQCVPVEVYPDESLEEPEKYIGFRCLI